MGFDLYGVRPVAESGKYFRNNVWWYRPLWGFVETVASDILTEDDLRSGSYNDGHEINKAKAEALAVRLLDVLKDKKTFGKAKQKLMDSETMQTKSPRGEYYYRGCFNKTNIKEFAKFCMASGGFTIS